MTTVLTLQGLSRYVAPRWGYDLYSDLGYAPGPWGYETYAQLGEVRARLEKAVDDAIAHCSSAGMSGLGQITDTITASLVAALNQMTPQLQQKAMEVLGPVLDEKLAEWGPKLAGITGVVAGILAVIGMLLVGGYVVKKVA